jgi:hypothetical protein
MTRYLLVSLPFVRGVNPEPVLDYWVITRNRLRGPRLLNFNNRLRNRVPRLFGPGSIFFKKNYFLGLFKVLDILFWTSFKHFWALFKCFSPTFKVLGLIQSRNFNYYNKDFLVSHFLVSCIHWTYFLFLMLFLFNKIFLGSYTIPDMVLFQMVGVSILCWLHSG